MKPRAYHLYIHAPWCKRHCPYCDFTVYTDRTPPFERWANKVLQDWHWHQDNLDIPLSPDTIYFGGGTPSLVPTAELERLISAFKGAGTSEITIEVNPGDVSPEKLNQYHAIGITRVSLGIQTFNRAHLRRLGRASTPADCTRLIQWVKEANFDSWSMDLMFGLPNQTIADLEQDLDTLLAFQPPHLSIYGLTYKPGTPFDAARIAGRLQEVNEDLWVVMFETIAHRMNQAGYQRYEVSNFCLPPHIAQHNEGIWKNESYVGLGPSAHGCWPDKSRTQYSSDWESWLTQQTPFVEDSDNNQQAIDWLLTAIRHHDGIHLPTLSLLGFEIPNHEQLPAPLSDFLILEMDRIRLAPTGWIVVNWVTEKILERLTPILQDEP